MGFRRTAVSYTLKGILTVLCKIDCADYIEKLSKNKPMLIVMNHINFLEVPALVAYSYPLNVTGVAKTETWNNPLLSFLFNSYNAIPIDRRGAFHDVFEQVRHAIDNGSFVCIFPEGTRSKNGVLKKGKAGIIPLAIDTGAPILPVVHYGGERIWNNMKKFKRTPFCFKAGNPFKINFEGRPDRETREEILSEIMGQMARLLPQEMRGIYSDHTDCECKHLEFI